MVAFYEPAPTERERRERERRETERERENALMLSEAFEAPRMPQYFQPHTTGHVSWDRFAVFV
jgi:hypothetical protein